MEVTSHCKASDITEGRANQSECIVSQSAGNGTLLHHSTDDAPPPLSDRSEDADSSDDSLSSSISRPLCAPPSSTLCHQKGMGSSSVSPPPICTPPSPSFTSPPPPPQSSTCNRLHHHCRCCRHQSTNQKCLSLTKSHASFKTDATQIKEVAGDDCCIHCLLACLFCELLSMCSTVGECLACGVGGSSCCDSAVDCCCCVEATCTEEACQAVLDCGILEDCCGSSNCLEICLECCSICFPS